MDCNFGKNWVRSSLRGVKRRGYLSNNLFGIYSFSATFITIPLITIYFITKQIFKKEDIETEVNPFDEQLTVVYEVGYNPFNPNVELPGDADDKSLKELMIDTSYVFFSVVVGLFIIEQFNGQKIKVGGTTTQVFTDNPNF